MQLFTPKHIDDVLIPNKKEWCSFYQQCKNQRDLNIACVGPHDTCKSTLLNIVILEFLKDHPEIQPKKLLYRLSVFDDIQLQHQPNDLSIFCQSHTKHDKIVYIDRFDEFTDQNQQWLKAYMDTYNILRKPGVSKVHFLIETTQYHKMKDMIKSRMNVFYTQSLTFREIHPIFRRLCETQCIQLHPNVSSFFESKQDISVSSIILFVQKMMLLNQSEITFDTLQTFYPCMDNTVFQRYLEYIQNHKLKEANEVLFALHENGYDISDIYYYLYEYIKEHSEYVHCIDVICYYIDQHYNGHYHDIFILFLTHDLSKKINGKLNSIL